MADRQLKGVSQHLGTLFRVGVLGRESDGALLDRFLDDPEPTAEAAFATLVERHGPMVLRVSRRLLPDPNDADDAAQAAFLLLARRARAIRKRDSVASWLFGVTLRVAHKARSRANHQRLVLRQFAEHAARTRPLAAPEPTAESPWADLYAELDRLPESLRAPIVLCYLEGQTHEQAADRLGVSLRTLRRRLDRARNRLRNRLLARSEAESAGSAPVSSSTPGAVSLVATLPDLARPPAFPILLAERTVRSALAFATGGNALLGSSSATAVTLAQEVLRAMLVSKLTATGTAALLLTGAFALAAVPIALGLPLPGDDPAPPVAAALPPNQDDDPEPPSAFSQVPDIPIPGGLDPRPPLPDWITQQPRTGPGRSTEIRIVSAATGEPIPNVAVRVWKALADEWRTADADGRISVTHSTGPADPSFSIDAWADGFAMQRHSFGDLPDEPIPDEATIPLHPGESLGGIVQDEQGRPVAGATVFLWSHNYTKRAPEELLYDLRATTGPDGRWRTGGAPETTGDLLGIYITHPDYVSDREYVAGRAKPPIEDLRAGTAVSTLKKGAYVEGRVLDADGNPVTGAIVASTQRPDTLFTSVRDFVAITDADGRYRTGQLAPGTWHLVAWSPEGAPIARELEIGTAISSVDLRLGHPRPLRLRLIDPEGEPIAGAFVNVGNWGRYRLLGIIRWTDAGGRASWDAAPDDPIRLNISANGYFGRLQAPVEPSDEEIVMTLRPGLSISGRVRDAETDARIERADVEVGAVDPETGEVPRWQARPDDIDYQWWVGDGRLNVVIPAEADAYRLRITAPGYAPFVSRIFRKDEGRVTDYDVSLQPPEPGGPAATVRMPDGSPLAGAQVLIARRRGGVSLRNGRPENRYANVNEGQTLLTSPEGTFPIPPADEPFVAVVVGDEGYAITTSTELAESPEVQARPFARIEGRYLIGDRPGPGVQITLRGHLQNSSTSLISIHSTHEATTDADGRFTFERVIPFEDLRVARQDEQETPGRVWSQGETVRIEPGETKPITLGGVGLPVVGRVARPDGWTEPVNFTQQATATVVSDQPVTPYPPELFRDQTTLQGGYWFEWSEAWRTTPEGRAFADQSRRVSVALAPDGSFRIDDVPPGDYRLIVLVGRNDLGPGNSPFAPISRSFTVPEVPGGRSDVPIDFETLRLRPRTTLEPGDPAPTVEITTLDGDRLTIPDDFRGRHLVLDFGTPANDQSRLQIARANGLHERFGTDDRIAFLSLVIAPDDAETRSFIAAKGQPWPQVLLGPLPNPVADAFGVEDTPLGLGSLLPGFVLIGPDGSILAVDTYGRDLEPILAETLDPEPAS